MQIYYCVWIFVICSSPIIVISQISQTPAPLILVPGDGGSRGYSDVDLQWFTRRSLVWVNFEYMLFPQYLQKVFKLQYDPVTHKTKDMNGSRVFFPGWGSTETIEQLDEKKHPATTYFSKLVNILVQDRFYVRNKTLRGAPYDFRKAPNENENFVPDLQKLIEDTFLLSNNQRVVILGHSLGSLYSLFFLKRMSIDWKKKYVRSFIAISGPLGGAVKAVTLETSGLSLGSPRNPKYFRTIQRSFPSSTFVLPRTDIFGKDPIVITPHKNYSSFDFDELFKDMNMPYGPMMYRDTKNLINGNETPEGIDDIYCIHGVGRPTPQQMIFHSFPDSYPIFVNGDGDSVVNTKSLEICKQWTNVNYFVIKGADHRKIVSNSEFIVLLKKILYQ